MSKNKGNHANFVEDSKNQKKHLKENGHNPDEVVSTSPNFFIH